MHIEGILPNPRYRIAAARVIPAPAERVWAHLLAASMRDLPLGFALTAARHLPAALARREPFTRPGDTFFDATPIPVVYADEPRRIISAGPSQAWRLLGGATPPIVAADDFARWAAPGWIKVAMQFDLVEVEGGTRLSTETRIAPTDAATARRFAPYWRAIRAGSELIRREVVAHVARSASR